MPVTLTSQPWARLYRFPDGRLLWTIRLWEGDRPVTRAVTTSVLLRYADSSRLRLLREEAERLVRRVRR